MIKLDPTTGSILVNDLEGLIEPVQPASKQPQLGTPLPPADEAALRARIDLIPCMQSLGMQIEAMGVGQCVLSMKHDPATDGIFESFHGGLLASAADTVACFAILTQTGLEQKLTTTDFHIRFLSACKTDVIAHARVIKLGRTLCPVAVELKDTSGKLVAIAQVTYLRLG